MKVNILSKSVLSVICASSFILSAHGEKKSSPEDFTDLSVVAQKTKTINGKDYHFVKKVNAKGQLTEEIRDSHFKAIPSSAIPRAKSPIINEDLLRTFNSLKAREVLKVNIALDFGLQAETNIIHSGGIQIDGIDVISSEFNNKRIDSASLTAKQQEIYKQERAAQKQYTRALNKHFSAWAKNYGFDQKLVEDAAKRGSETLTVEIDKQLLDRLLKSNDSRIIGIELYQEASDDITQAMVDTSISSSALVYSSTRGDDIGIYMTESGCANESRITNYDRLSGSETNHARNVGAIIRAVSPDSFLYCRGGAVLPNDSDLDGVGNNPPIYIVTRSNSSNDTTNYNTLDRDWDNFVYNKGVATFNSGGNTGNGTGNVRSPGKGLNLITVGNYNDSNDTIVSSSPFVDPNIGNQKPEVSAPGASITAGGFTMTGTSQSTPHAAAFSADMMSHSTYLKNKPYLLKAKLLAGATDSISGGADKVGLGGIDFASAQWSGHYQWYSGNNASYNTFDKNDGKQDGYIEKKINISSSWRNVRAVISWMNRGTHTYNKRNDAHPIGMDIDLRVYDPNGKYIGGSFSFDNPYEVVNFDPTISGEYTFKIRRYSNRDTSSKFQLGLYVNYYN